MMHGTKTKDYVIMNLRLILFLLVISLFLQPFYQPISAEEEKYLAEPNSDFEQIVFARKGLFFPLREKRSIDRQGPPACCGSFTNYASYQLFICPSEEACPLLPCEPISFQRQVLKKGFSITSHSPFNTFELAPGIYEITLGISTDALSNQIQLLIGSKITSFTPYAVVSDFMIFTKTIRLRETKKVKVIPTTRISFPVVDSPSLAAYINFIRLQ